jgi:Thioredoxin like C-terminal domain
VIIGVHAPEFAFEKKRENVEDAIQEAGIRYPNVLDNNFTLWNAYQNQFWPAKYFVDKEGKVRHTHFGEGAYEESEQVIQKLLSEGSTNKLDIPISQIQEPLSIPVISQSPETYVGLARRANFVQTTSLEPNQWTLFGDWKSEPESITSQKDASLKFHFQAKDVYLVLGGSGTLSVTVDGQIQFP